MLTVVMLGVAVLSVVAPRIRVPYYKTDKSFSRQSIELYAPILQLIVRFRKKL